MDKLKINDYGLTPLTYDEASGINGGQPIVIAAAVLALFAATVGVGSIGMTIANAGIGLVDSIFNQKAIICYVLLVALILLTQLKEGV